LVWILGGAVAVLAVVVVGLVAVLLLRDSGDGTTESTSPPTTSPIPLSTTTSTPGRAGPTVTTPDGPVALATVTMQEGAIQRQYLVMSPVEVPSTTRLPAVMVLHGLGIDRTAMSKTADWAGAVAKDRFLAVFPQGVLNSWNVGPCCPPASLAKVDDIGFLDRVVAQLVARPDVDSKRLYLTGFSNGGIMVYAMACANPGTFAAVAPMAGTNLTGCAPKEPVSLLHLHGDPDPVVPYDGRKTLSQLLSTAPFPPVPQTVAAWAAADRCDADPSTQRSAGPVTTTRWTGCPPGIEVELVTYPGNGHAWPKRPVDGLTELLRFFDLAS
jgi:polyhydroxybutyrate depolymerase